MTNRVTLIGKVLGQPKVRSFEARGGTIEIVSLWLEVKDDHREHVQLPFTGRPRPVARLETRRTRRLRHNLAIEDFPRALSVLDSRRRDKNVS